LQESGRRYKNFAEIPSGRKIIPSGIRAIPYGIIDIP
jgi:hypothetical protein